MVLPLGSESRASYFFHGCSDRSTFLFIVCGILRASQQYKNFSSAVFIKEVITISFSKSQHEHTIINGWQKYFKMYLAPYLVESYTLQPTLQHYVISCDIVIMIIVGISH